MLTGEVASSPTRGKGVRLTVYQEEEKLWYTDD